MSAQPAAEPPQACLKWNGGSLPLSGSCVIGRRSDNDLPVSNVQVSRRHALLISHNDDWWLNDLGSRNGVYVNGIRLTSARRLRNGDEIRIANHRFIFSHDGQPAPHHSSIAGSTTQVALPDQAEGPTPATVTCELIIASAQGEVLEGEKAAHWFFGKALRRVPGSEHYQLPKPVRDWLSGLAQDGPVERLEMNHGDLRVLVSLARRKEDRFFLLVREESLAGTLDQLRSLDLTGREAEVAHWMCEGKKNPEIASIIEVSTHTVNRHIEHIYKKLGVDNRHKAVKVLNERRGA